MRPHRRQPTRLPRPWDSAGKNTGVGCHFLLQCMKVKSESEVTQSCLTLSDPVDCSLPGSSIHGIFQARVLEWGAIAFPTWYSIEFGLCQQLRNLGVLFIRRLLCKNCPQAIDVAAFILSLAISRMVVIRPVLIISLFSHKVPTSKERWLQRRRRA